MTRETKKILANYLENDCEIIKVIAQAIEEEYGITIKELKSEGSDYLLSNIRIIFVNILQKYYPELLRSEVATLLNRNHATITYYLKEYDGRYKYSLRFRKLNDKIEDRTKELLKQNKNGVE